MEMIFVYPAFIGMSVAVAQLARQRGYSGLWWFIIATLLPIISIFLVFMLKKKERRKSRPEPNWAKQKLPNDRVIYSSGE
jgi:cytochrome bd-type quinol oxidase subunit 2